MQTQYTATHKTYPNTTQQNKTTQTQHTTHARDTTHNKTQWRNTMRQTKQNDAEHDETIQNTTQHNTYNAKQHETTPNKTKHIKTMLCVTNKWHTMKTHNSILDKENPKWGHAWFMFLAKEKQDSRGVTLQGSFHCTQRPSMNPKASLESLESL